MPYAAFSAPAVRLSALSRPFAAALPHGLAAAAVAALAGLAPAASDRVEALLARMTLEEKAGQMTQLTLAPLSASEETATTRHSLDQAKVRDAIVTAHVGSIINTFDRDLTPQHWRSVIGDIQRVATKDTRLGIPILYGVDSVHGANYVRGATIMPHNLTLGATWNPALARAAGAVTAAETRAVGIPWNFAPVMDVMRQPAWSRVFETFGEDPTLGAAMSAAAVRGMQGDAPWSDAGTALAGDTVLAACGKHFLGYSAPRTGRDRTPAMISAAELHDVFVPPFRAAMAAGLRTVMINSGEINGVPVHADPRVLTTLLRDELKFDGVAVTDWEDVIKLVNFHHVAADQKEAALMAVNAGIDLSMTPYTTDFPRHIVELVKEGRLSESRVDESVRRVLRLKEELGLFEKPLADEAAANAIGSQASADVSLAAAREGIVLLRNNDGVLPLKPDAKILVTGPAANDLVPVYGSWSFGWQGTKPENYPKTPTILDAMKARFGEANVTYALGATFTDAADPQAAGAAAVQADAVVLCLGELPSTEKIGDISDLQLSWAQEQLAWAAVSSGKPVIAVLVTNRPRVLGPVADQFAAVLWAGHPGPKGPQALAEILAGEVNPSGRLPFSYPRATNALLTYDHKHSESFDGDNGTRGYDPLFPFGAGIGYSAFAYSGLAATPAAGERGIDVRVTVTNTGDRPGMEVVQVYLSDEVATVTPAVKRLKAFDKIELAAGQSRELTFRLPESALTFSDRDGKPTFEPGAFTVRVAGESATLTVR